MNPKYHINDNQAIGYIYRTLNDADRETINQHLAGCQACRGLISQYEIEQRHLSNALKAEINGISLPEGISFSRIAPELEKRRPTRFWIRFSSAPQLASAAIALLLAVWGLWQTLGTWISLKTLPTPDPALSVIATFFFMFVSIDQFDRSHAFRPRFILAVILTCILWLGTLIIGILNLFVIMDLVVAGFLALGGSRASATFLASLTVILFTLVYIAVVVGGAEFHYKNIGQPQSWKLFIWTLSIQLFIMVLPFFLL